MKFSIVFHDIDESRSLRLLMALQGEDGRNKTPHKSHFPLVQRPLIEISPMARTRAQAHIWPSSTYKPRARWKNITYTLSPQNYPRADRFCNKKVLGEPPRSIEQFLA